MKRLLLVLSIVAGMQIAYAQKSVYTNQPNRLFSQGKEMFVSKNYTGATHFLEQFKKESKDNLLICEAEYMLVSSMYHQGKMEAGNLMKDYLDQYPETIHRNQLCFFIGSVHFDEKDWKKSLFWLSQSEIDLLNIEDQEDYAYRSAYSNLQSGNRDKATNMFVKLAENSKKYGDQASYYLAYIYFQKQRYADALPLLRKLKNKPAYKENATFFLIQATYVSGKENETITEGLDYLKSFPKSANSGEVYRMLGSCYYRAGNLNAAITNYEKYATSDNPFREDIYQLADAYYQTQQYAKAVKALENVASTTDELGQAGNMLLGLSSVKLNDLSNALMAFDAAARSKFDPTISEEALYNYVMITNKESLSLFGQSITAFQRFLTEYPKSKYSNEVNSALASTILSTKNYNMALDAIAKIKSPSNHILQAKQTVLYQLGVQQFINGIYDVAIKTFSSTIDMGSYDTEARNESYFWRGDSYYKQNNYNAAAKDYKAYVEIASTSGKNYATAFYNLAYTGFKTKNYSQALIDFKKYAAAEKNRQSPNYADAMNRIADCYLNNRNFAEAQSYYTQAVTTNPSNADYSEFQKAYVMGLQHNYSGKVTALNNLMAKHPESNYYPDALFEKSRALTMLGKDAEAISPLETMLHSYPNSPLAQKASVQLGQLYFNTNDPQRSISAYKQAIRLGAKTDDARSAILSLEAVYKEIDDINAYADFVKSLGSTNVLRLSRQDSLTYLAAENQYMKGRKKEAKTSFTKYLGEYPRGAFESDAHYYLASMAMEAKDEQVALIHFRNVITENNPKFIDDALITASGIDFDSKHYEEAYKYYKRLDEVTKSSDNLNIAQLGMLRCAYLMKKNSEVIASATKLIDNKNTTEEVALEAHFYRAQSLRDTGKTKEAIADFNKITENTRSALGAESQYLLLEIYYNNKSYDKAEKQIIDFMKEGTPHEYWLAKSIIVLSDTYAAKNDKFRARQYLESLQSNYKGTQSDIKEMIQSRLKALNKVNE